MEWLWKGVAITVVGGVILLSITGSWNWLIKAIRRSWLWLHEPLKELPLSEFRFDHTPRWTYSRTRYRYFWRLFLQYVLKLRTRVRWGTTKRQLEPEGCSKESVRYSPVAERAGKFPKKDRAT